MTRDEALVKLGTTTAEAVASVLQMFAPGGCEHGIPTIVSGDRAPLASVPLPAVAANVSYVDGVTGGNLFVITLAGAKRLAAAMMGEEPGELGSELTELELSAVSEAMNQMMAGTRQIASTDSVSPSWATRSRSPPPRRTS